MNEEEWQDPRLNGSDWGDVIKEEECDSQLVIFYVRGNSMVISVWLYTLGNQINSKD